LSTDYEVDALTTESRVGQPPVCENSALSFNGGTPLVRIIRGCPLGPSGTLGLGYTTA